MSNRKVIPIGNPLTSERVIAILNAYEKECDYRIDMKFPSDAIAETIREIDTLKNKMQEGFSDGKELIKAVLHKPDGVYLNSKGSNDNYPFKEWKCEGLTAIYKYEGQRSIDREIVRMLCEYAEIEGNHPSVERYKPCLKARTHYEMFLDIVLDDEFDRLSPEDIRTVWFPKEQQTEGAKAYNALKKMEEKFYYARLANCAAPLVSEKRAACISKLMAR